MASAPVPLPAKVPYVKRQELFIHTSVSLIVQDSRRTSNRTGALRAALSLELDTGPVQTDHKVSLLKLMVQLDQLLVANFVPIFGFAPQFIEFLSKGRILGVVESEILVDGAPCAIQGTCNPSVDQILIRS